MSEFFDEARFRSQVDKGIARARTVLDNEKRPTYPADVPHKYEDKYWLAEFLTKTALVSQLQCLEQLGVNPKTLRQIKDWSRDRSVTLSLHVEEKCVYDREEKREEEAPTKHVRDYGVGKIVDKVVTTITEWFWNFTVHYQLFVYVGAEPSDRVPLQQRVGKYEVKTTVKNSPYPEVKVRDPINVNFSWLLHRVTDDTLFQFQIDRNSKDCHTPRRNPQVEEALEHFRAFSEWSNAVDTYFRRTLFSVQVNHGLDLDTINAKTVFVPVLPLFEERRGQVAADAPGASKALVPLVHMTPEQSTVLLQGSDLNRFLDEQKRSLAEKCSEMAKVFPDGGKLITVAEANICVTAQHARDITQHYFDGVNYIEAMLRKQIIAAIGKEVTPVDFANYMVFHNRKVYREEFQPRAFSYAVRRPNHYPEGILSLEGQLADGSMPDPVQTIVSRAELSSPMFFPINASSKVAFKGEAYLHAWIGTSFEGASGLSLSLNARARQFSSFLVLVGRISGPGLFDPQFGMVVQNKDEINIPLDTETIPTPKEFRDAIESLSPEQQRFAKAFRALQLSSTLFGVCVLQLKPQLEKVLKLGYDGLTKEIRLTQDLLKLFIEFQIPPDLLSFGGPEPATDADRLQGVKQNVAAIQEVIEKAKQKEIEDARQEAELRVLESEPRLLERAKAPSPRMMSVSKSASRSSAPSAPMAMSMSMSAPSPSAPPGAAPAAAPAAVAATPAPAPAPAPAPVADAPPAPADAPAETPKPSTEFDAGSSSSAVVDYTKIPHELDAKFEKLDEDGAMRPTILNVGHVWSKRSKKALLADFQTASLSVAEQKLERQTCFDLLDALTKSGCVPFDGATLHVIMASTHCFASSIMNTLVQDNVNPIEKVERSSLIVATTIHGRSAQELLKPAELERVKAASGMLFLPASEEKK